MYDMKSGGSDIFCFRGRGRGGVRVFYCRERVMECDVIFAGNWGRGGDAAG